MKQSDLYWRLVSEYQEGYYVLTGHNSGNEVVAVRLCSGGDYVTRKFQDSRLAQPFIESALRLTAQLEAGGIVWEQAKEDF